MGAFAQIALVAREREIFEVVSAAVFAGVDMLDVKGIRVVVFLSEPAVLTAVSGALPHLLAEDRGHQEAG
jgi:hypothetical protein